jgi:hypothetical protein
MTSQGHGIAASVVHMIRHSATVGLSHHDGNPAITVIAILAGQLGHVRTQAIFIRTTSGHMALS